MRNEIAVIVERAVGDEQQATDRDRKNGALDEERGAVHRNGTLDDDPPQVGNAGIHDDEHEGRHEADKGQRGLGEGPLPARQEGLEDDADSGRPEDDQHRRNRPVLDAR